MRHQPLIGHASAPPLVAVAHGSRDPRAAARLPERIGLTVRGGGPFRRLDLDLEPDQWGDLLYT